MPPRVQDKFVIMRLRGTLIAAKHVKKGVRVFTSGGVMTG
jgi:hypothetical protein